jgi:hypothetical protein
LGKVKSRFHEEKVFCIGLNKTGTTSLEYALKNLGYAMGNQQSGEMLLSYYIQRQFEPIVEFARSADAFQDAPFSYPMTFVPLDQAFPKAKFILTIRDSVDQWYRSLVRFHSRIFAGGRRPVREDLEKATYCYPGFVWDAHRYIFNPPDDDIYDPSTLKNFYENHNYSVQQYFRTKKNFLQINLSEPRAYLRMCDFLGKEPQGSAFPWLNRTEATTP